MPDYGTAHRAERARWAVLVARGEGWCTEPECLMDSRRIEPGSAWDLAHDATLHTYRGPAHALCNRSEGGRRARATERDGGLRRWAL